MPRLLAVEGPEIGLALPLLGNRTCLVAGPTGRLRLVRGETPETGLAVERGTRGGWWLRRLGPRGRATPVFLNGLEVDTAALSHGDLVTFAGATLVFDTDEQGAQTTRGGASAAPAPGAHVHAGGAPEPELAGGSICARRRVVEGAAAALPRGDRPTDRTTLRLATLLEIGAALSETLELGATLRAVLDRMFDVLPADRGTILVLDRPTRSLRSMVGKVRGAPADEGTQFAVSRTIVREALRTREAILTVDAMSDERFQSGASVAAEGIGSALCIPVMRRGRVRAVIHLDSGDRNRPFGREDLELGVAIAGLAALAIDNAILFAHTAERERIASELDIANAIQQRLLPRERVEVAGLAAAGRMLPARELGGDIFDLVRGPDDTVHVVVGDVSGKGMGSALVMAMARSYLRPLMRAEVSPRQALIEVNRWLHADTAARIFMSAIYARWEPERGRLRWCGAGQEHVLVYRDATGAVETQTAGGMALALVDDVSEFLEDREVALAPGDAVLLYSDGVIDARNAAKEGYGLKRLEGLFARAAVTAAAAGGDAELALDTILEALEAWTRGAEPHDDITAVVLLRTP
jgi:serine phosphatase RsbU (regulator of sigma subunit)